MGIQGKLWSVIRNIFSVNQICIYLHCIRVFWYYTECCILTPALFLIFADDSMKEIESKVSFLPSLQLNDQTYYLQMICWN